MSTRFPNGIGDPLIQSTVSVPLAIAASATSVTGIEVIQEAKKITGASVAFHTVPASTLGTVTFALHNADVSESDTDNLLSTTTISLEALTADTEKELTLTTTTADLSLAAGDYVYATIVSDNADMTDGAGGVVTITYDVA